MSGEKTPIGLQPDGTIISRCGLVCNTCTAFITGACPGCHALKQGECVIRDCADLQGTSCLDCQVNACYHFEAYAIRRALMNAKAKRFYRLMNSVAGARAGSGCGGCAARGCGQGGGCCAAGGGGCCAVVRNGAGATSNGCQECPAARIAERLAALVP